LLPNAANQSAGVSAGNTPQGLLRDDEGHWLLSINLLMKSETEA